MKRILVTAVLCAAALAAMPAGAQEIEHRGWFLRGGLVGVYFDPGADVDVAGMPLPGSDISLHDNYSATLDIGYRFNRNWSATFTLGIPPEVEVKGEGALSGSHLGNLTYGPMALVAQYWLPTKTPKFRPYVGAGINYTVVFDTDDVDVADFEVDNNWGSVFQIGFESMIDEQLGLFFDVTKIFVDTDASGKLGVGGPPATADVTLDPLLVRTGVVWRF